MEKIKKDKPGDGLEYPQDKPGDGLEYPQDKPGDGLVEMTKNGETIRVDTTCVKAHELVGWKLAK